MTDGGLGIFLQRMPCSVKANDRPSDRVSHYEGQSIDLRVIVETLCDLEISFVLFLLQCCMRLHENLT